MSIRSKIAALALATLAVTGTIASTTTQAEAKPFGLGWGIGAGIVRRLARTARPILPQRRLSSHAASHSLLCQATGT